MITKMKKLTLFMTESSADVDADLTLLGQLGVMHITPLQPASDASIERVQKRIKQLEKAIAILDQYDGIDSSSSYDFNNQERGDIALMEKALELEDNRIKFENLKKEQNSSLAWFDNWGQVSVNDLNTLKEHGISIKMYLLTDKELKNSIAPEMNISLLGKQDNLNQVILITENDEKIDYEELYYPNREYYELSASLAIIKNELETTISSIKALCPHKQVLQDALLERKRRFDVRNVQFGGLSIDSYVRCLEGYIPKYSIEKVVAAAKDHCWGYVISEPASDELDKVPTLVKSPKWVERIKPVMSFMGLVPGYNEIDVSKVFMIFFTFFTGILVGDAGYGLLFFIATLLIHKKKKFQPKVEFHLFYTLSLSILFWGGVTGTYFGSQAISELPIFKALTISKIASFGGDEIFLQRFIFTLGAIHLTIGHLQAAFKQMNSIKAIGQLGWVAICWGLYYVVNSLVLGIPSPAIMNWLFIGGITLVALFSNAGPNFFKGVLSSLGNLPLSIINGFSDVISYIRLYAVGLSTVLMAVSFNDLALGDGELTLISGLIAAIVLVLGHGLNMVLAAMSVLVHGVRLNMLEYAGHAGVEFTGNNYNPFTIKNKQQ